MIYSDDFVWLHFPKCAGTKIENIFLKYFLEQDEIIQDLVGIKKDPLIKWHDSISVREKRDLSFKLGERVIIFPIRKLPSWLESRYNFEVNRNPHLSHEPELLLKGNFLESNGYMNQADCFIKSFLPESVLDSTQLKFIRMEYFEMDFKNIFGKYIDLSKIPDKEYSQKVNTSQNYIPERIRRELRDSKNNVYDYCPYWKKVEELAYQ